MTSLQSLRGQLFNKDAKITQASDNENHHNEDTYLLLSSCINGDDNVSLSFTKYLINHLNYNVNWRDEHSGNTLLHCTSYYDNIRQSRLLLLAGINPNAKNCNKETALHWSCKLGHLRSATLLLNNGANINITDKSGSTALHLSVVYGVVEMITFLITRGIDVDVIDNDGYTAYELCKEGNLHSKENQAIKVIFERLLNSHTHGSNNNHSRNGQNSSKVKQAASKLETTQDFVDDLSNNASKYKLKVKTNLLKGNSNTTATCTYDETKENPLNSATPIVVADRMTTISKIAAEFVFQVMYNNQLINHNTMSQYKRYKARKSNKSVSPAKQLKRITTSSSSVNVAYANSKNGIQSKFIIRKVDYNDISSVVPVETQSSKSGLETSIGILPRSLGTAVATPSALAHKIDAPIKDRDDEFIASFPPAVYIPFLPSDPAHMDIFISVEQCCDCEKHNWSLHHDPKKYNSYGDLILAGILSVMVSSNYPIRIHVYKAKATKNRIGACEATISLYNNDKQSKNKLPSGWITYTVHSKLESTNWPLLENIVKKSRKFMHSVMRNFNIKAPLYVQVSDSVIKGLQDWVLATGFDLSSTIFKIDETMLRNIHPMMMVKSIENRIKDKSAKVAATAATSDRAIDTDESIHDNNDIDTVNTCDNSAYNSTSNTHNCVTENTNTFMSIFFVPPSKDDLADVVALRRWEIDTIDRMLVLDNTI